MTALQAVSSISHKPALKAVTLFTHASFPGCELPCLHPALKAVTSLGHTLQYSRLTLEHPLVVDSSNQCCNLNWSYILTDQAATSRIDTPVAFGPPVTYRRTHPGHNITYTPTPLPWGFRLPSSRGSITQSIQLHYHPVTQSNLLITLVIPD